MGIHIRKKEEKKEGEGRNGEEKEHKRNIKNLGTHFKHLTHTKQLKFNHIYKCKTQNYKILEGNISESIWPWISWYIHKYIIYNI